MKKQLKQKEQEYLSLDNDLGNLKQKSQSSEHFLTHEIQKYKEELEKIKSDYEQEATKNMQLNEQNGHLGI